MKGQAATNFISELTPMKVVGEPTDFRPTKVVELTVANRVETESKPEAKVQPEESSATFWKLFVDGSVTKRKRGAGIILETPDGFKH